MVHHACAVLADRGYADVVTGALSAYEQRGFLDAGFTVREELHLLGVELHDLPRLTRGRAAPGPAAAPARRPRRRRRRLRPVLAARRGRPRRRPQGHAVDPLPGGHRRRRRHRLRRVRAGRSARATCSAWPSTPAGRVGARPGPAGRRAALAVATAGRSPPSSTPRSATSGPSSSTPPSGSGSSPRGWPSWPGGSRRPVRVPSDREPSRDAAEPERTPCRGASRGTRSRPLRRAWLPRRGPAAVSVGLQAGGPAADGQEAGRGRLRLASQTSWVPPDGVFELRVRAHRRRRTSTSPSPCTARSAPGRSSPGPSTGESLGRRILTSSAPVDRPRPGRRRRRPDLHPPADLGPDPGGGVYPVVVDLVDGETLGRPARHPPGPAPDPERRPAAGRRLGAAARTPPRPWTPTARSSSGAPTS